MVSTGREWTTVWHGAPRTKKNSRTITGNGLLQSAAFRRYEKQIEVERFAHGRPLFEGACEVKAIYFLDSETTPDLLGLLQGTSDLLEGVAYYDDVQVVSYDESRIAGIDRKRPRVEITVREVGQVASENAAKKVRAAKEEYWHPEIKKKPAPKRRKWGKNERK